MSWGVPKATGPYPVGCHDILDQPGLNSSFFRIYYPTKTFKPDDKTGPDWMEPEYLQAISQYMGAFQTFKVPVLRDGPLVIPANIAKLPVVVISHGLLMSKDAYSFVGSDLASYGFLVVALDHRDGSACASMYMEEVEGKLVKKWLPFDLQVGIGSPEETPLRVEQVGKRLVDLERLMDSIEKLHAGTLSNLLNPAFDLIQFRGKIDVEKSAAWGHSHGAATVIAAMATEKRLKACVSMDPWMLAIDDKYYKMRIEKPMIFINCLGEIKKFDILKLHQLDADITGISAERTMVTILGTTHLTQCDFGFFPTSWLEAINFKAENDPKEMNAIMTKLTLSFVRRHLGLADAGNIDTIIKENAKYAFYGTDIKVEEKEIKEAKAEIKSQLQ